MSWVKLDDAFLTNPKVMRAGLEARALYVAGLCYCSAGLTDGVIPQDAIAKLAALADLRSARKAVLHLVALGLWEHSVGGYRVHDYLKYQPSADDVHRERERVAVWRSERVRNADGTYSKTRSEHVPKHVPNATPSRPVPNGDGDVLNSMARPRDAAPGAAPRAAPLTREQEDEPASLRPGQQQCPMCPEVFPDNAALRDHLDNSPRHKVRPVPEDFSGNRSSSSAQKVEPETPPDIAAELAALATRPRLKPEDLPPDIAAEHERLLAQEHARNGRKKVVADGA